MSEQTKTKKGKKNRKNVPTEGTGGDIPPIGIVERIANVRIDVAGPSRPFNHPPHAAGADAGQPRGSVQVKPPKKGDKGKLPSAGKSGRYVDINIKDAFIKENDEIEVVKKSKPGKFSSAEDSFVELEKMTGLSLSKLKVPYPIPKRPTFKSGNLGKKTRVVTNFFRMSVRGNPVQLYHVTFLQAENIQQEHEVGRVFKRLTKQLNQKLLATFVQTRGAHLFGGVSYAYDNDRILITSTPIEVPADGEIYTFVFQESPQDPQLTICIQLLPTVCLPLVFERDCNSLDLMAQNRAVLQAIDIIAKSHAFRNDIIYGSKIFLGNGNRIQMMLGRNNDLPTPYELAFGYHQSTQFCQGGVMSNIDRVTAVLFAGGPLVRTMERLLQTNLSGTEINQRQRSLLNELTFVRIETDYRGFPSRHNLRAFTPTRCDETFFTIDGGQQSVANYFRDHYNIHLAYPNLPCVEYSPNRYIPAELCTIIPNQRNKRRLREELIRIVSQHTTTQRPQDRLRALTDTAVNISNQLTQNRFDIELNASPVVTDCRIIPSPFLRYSNNTRFSPRDPGSWDMRDSRFFTPVALARWAVISLSRRIDAQVADGFFRALQRTGTSLGMDISNPSLGFRQITINQLSETFKAAKSKNLQLIVVIMPEDAEYYSKVKSLGDKRLGVPTQVVLDKHYDSRNTGKKQKIFDMAYLSNLLLKINMKIGGTNLRLSDSSPCRLLNKKTMVVGIDVNHPSPGENAPSIAAVVGSISEDFSQYRTEIHVNDTRNEIVTVSEMIKPIIKVFKQVRGFFPDHIVVYRDGVSEGQFATVMENEILPLHKVLDTIPDGPPKLTYIIVQKRHNTRFFPMDDNKTRNGNILPGSVIDKDICHYKWFDFYLCSQNSFLGTARPSKYTVLWHSCPETFADDIQMATYYLCYLFARATKSIADPAPARYAHHAAARGKVHLKEILQQGRRIDQANQELQAAVNVVGNLQQILYFI